MLLHRDTSSCQMSTARTGLLSIDASWPVALREVLASAGGVPDYMHALIGMSLTQGASTILLVLIEQTAVQGKRQICHCRSTS